MGRIFRRSLHCIVVQSLVARNSNDQSLNMKKEIYTIYRKYFAKIKKTVAESGHFGFGRFLVGLPEEIH